MTAQEEKRAEVQQAILGWYREGNRELPWRHTRDSYAILVSEIMLQQTQVDRVLPKFHEFLGLYPTLKVLAAAPRAEVIRNWSPLGYNMRAVRLHEIARQAVERFGGRLPETLEGLLSLKGIGRYTAAAVMCFAYGAPEAVLDTNVRRVLGRIFAEEAPTALEDDRVAWALAEDVLPNDAPESAYDWNQALMDLGATVCVSRVPRCLVCPAQRWCSAWKLWYGGEVVVQEGLPLVAERKASYVVSRSNGAKRVAKKAEPFEGSRRWYRGRIVDALRKLPPGDDLDLGGLRAALSERSAAVDEAKLYEIVLALVKDGLVTMRGEGVEMRVRLPE
ncbi:MAG TPA: A/G-specific adenine glycosylase [Chloroflexota bacterium]|nr:A/G-specific adenine glycosylase [Chloroflexota bacterium]